MRSKYKNCNDTTKSTCVNCYQYNVPCISDEASADVLLIEHRVTPFKNTVCKMSAIFLGLNELNSPWNNVYMPAKNLEKALNVVLSKLWGTCSALFWYKHFISRYEGLYYNDRAVVIILYLYIGNIYVGKPAASYCIGYDYMACIDYMDSTLCCPQKGH